MKLKLNGKKYKYKPTYSKRAGKFNLKPPSFLLFRKGLFFYNNEWKECMFYIIDKPNKSLLQIRPINFSYDRESFPNGFVDIVRLSKYNRFKIQVFDLFYISKVYFLIFLEKINWIKKNFYGFLIAFILSLLYFILNYYGNNFLQELISDSLIVQSIIIFLSFSTLLNIFYPFTIRKEWTIEEIDKLVEKRIEKHKQDLDHELYRKEQTNRI